MMRTMKLGILALLGICTDCAWADRDLQPGPAPVVGMSVGAAYNSASILLKRPWWEQLTGTMLIAGAGRFTPLFGRKMEGWQFEVVFGGSLAQWLNLVVCRRNDRGECHR